MSNEIWRVVVDASVRRMIKRIPLADAEAITATLVELSEDPYGGDIQKLQGEEAWRRRVRSYRLRYRNLSRHSNYIRLRTQTPHLDDVLNISSLGASNAEKKEEER